MAENTKIEWATHTFNPWRGCTKVAEGCANCYADALSKRNPSTLGIWGPNGTRVMAAPAAWREPVKWNKAAAAAGERHRVFCASLTDVFEDWQFEMRDSKGQVIHQCERCGTRHGGDAIAARGFECGAVAAPFDKCPRKCEGTCRVVSMNTVRSQLFELIDKTPHLDWLLLTKRPENILRMWPISPGIPATCVRDGSIYYERPTQLMHRPNVWLLTSIANQADADKNIPELLKCRDLTDVLGVSAEPLIGPVELYSDGIACKPCRHCLNGVPDHETNVVECRRCDSTGISDELAIDWVIVGGESGHNVRPFVVEYGADIVRQCRAAGVPVFFKQMGSFVATTNANLHDFPEGTREAGWGKFAASCRYLLNDPKGGAMVEWPEELRVREFPRVAAEVASQQ